MTAATVTGTWTGKYVELKNPVDLQQARRNQSPYWVEIDLVQMLGVGP